jgi:hypothetical protein
MRDLTRLDPCDFQFHPQFPYPYGDLVARLNHSFSFEPSTLDLAVWKYGIEALMKQDVVLAGDLGRRVPSFEDFAQDYLQVGSEWAHDLALLANERRPDLLMLMVKALVHHATEEKHCDSIGPGLIEIALSTLPAGFVEELESLCVDHEVFRRCVAKVWLAPEDNLPDIVHERLRRFVVDLGSL